MASPRGDERQASPQGARANAPSEDPDFVELPLTVDDNAPRRARQVVAEVVGRWHVGNADITYSAQTVVTELVSNAVRHGGGVVSVELSRREGSVVIAVRDGSAILPHLRDSTSADVDGRGLRMIEGVSAEWGVDVLPAGGKRVWARLAP